MVCNKLHLTSSITITGKTAELIMNKFVNLNTREGTTRASAEEPAHWVFRPGENLTLYLSPLCGYCYRVLMTINQLKLSVDQKNIITDNDALSALLKGGGKRTVPCLHIEHEGKSFWMYESADIIAYLIQNYSQN